MQYNVAQLLKAHVGADLRAPLEGSVDLESEEARLVSPVSGEVRFQRTNQGIVATISYRATLQLTCVRCLDTFEQPIEGSFTEMFVPIVDVNTGNPVQGRPDDDAFTIDKERGRAIQKDTGDEFYLIDRFHQIDLAPTVREQIILALPSMPICREDCAGLCPECGVNLNDNPGHTHVATDERWGQLANLTLPDAED